MMTEKATHRTVLGGLSLLFLLLMIHGLSVFFASHLRGDTNESDEFSSAHIHELSSYNKITLGVPISINRENSEALTAIPGIGPKTAYMIVREREKRGGFHKPEDLKAVKGIGPKLFEKIKPFVTVN